MSQLLCRYVKAGKSCLVRAVLVRASRCRETNLSLCYSARRYSDEYESDLFQDNLAEMIRRFDETGTAVIMVEPVEDVTAYGVVDCKGVELAPGESVPMVGVVETKVDVAPFNLYCRALCVERGYPGVAGENSPPPGMKFSWTTLPDMPMKRNG